MERSDTGPESEGPAVDTAKVFDSVGEELVRGRLAARMFGRRVQPRRFGRFELRAPVGQGGMGTVYAAWDPVLEREVALKVVDTAGMGPTMVERALREARSLAKLSHPNVVSVFEAGQLEARVWIAMELLAGQTLGQWVQREPPPGRDDVLRMWIAVGRGLQAVHEAGLVHRDVKPGNVVVGEDGRPRLIDFGLVRDPGGTPGELSVSQTDGHDSQPSAGSQTEGFVGTLAYAAPEQHTGAPLDARADQYALCVSIWEALCGERPQLVDGSDAVAAPPAGHGMPSAILRALQRGLARDPAERHPSLAPLLAELESAVTKRARRLAWVVGTAAVSVLATSMALAGEAEQAPVDPCPLGDREIPGTWDAERKDALRQRLGAEQRVFVERTTAQLEAQLDAWVLRWRSARQAACVATKVEGVQSEAALDQRNACLERKRRSVDALLETMLDARLGIDVAAHAPELLRELPKLEACADPTRLAQVQPLPPPGPDRDALEAAYAEVTQVRTLANVGDFGRAGASIANVGEQ